MVDLVFFAPIAVGFVAGYAARDIQARGGAPDAIDRFLAERERELRERYETTEMDYVEFGDAIAVVEDPDTERIMRDATDIDGIGPATAFALAQRFDGYDAYREGDAEAYREVNQIGEQLGRSLARRN